MCPCADVSIGWSAASGPTPRIRMCMDRSSALSLSLALQIKERIEQRLLGTVAKVFYDVRHNKMLQITLPRRGLWSGLQWWMRWNRSHAVASGEPAGATQPLKANAAVTEGVQQRVDSIRKGNTTLDHLEAVVRARRTWRQYNPTRRLPQDTLQRVIDATMRSPTAFNLQGWTMVVVQDTTAKERLAAAALGQPHVRSAAATIVFAGDKEAMRNAPLALELGMDSKALPAGYGPGYLRNVYYFLQGGPFQSLAAAKSLLSSAYSKSTGTPLLSVPVNMTGYAWKQAMIPATTFVYLATAAGWETCILEGIDEDAVRRAVNLPSNFTVPVIVTVGFPVAGTADPPMTPRFSQHHFVHHDRFQQQS